MAERRPSAAPASSTDNGSRALGGRLAPKQTVDDWPYPRGSGQARELGVCSWVGPAGPRELSRVRPPRLSRRQGPLEPLCILDPCATHQRDAALEQGIGQATGTGSDHRRDTGSRAMRKHVPQGVVEEDCAGRERLVWKQRRHNGHRQRFRGARPRRHRGVDHGLQHVRPNPGTLARRGLEGLGGVTTHRITPPSSC